MSPCRSDSLSLGVFFSDQPPFVDQPSSRKTMACRCNTHILSQFVRSVTQIDLSATPSLAAAGKLQRPSIRTSPATRAFRSQQITSRSYSAAAESRLEQWPKSRDDVVPQSSDENATVEFSLDAIDAIAAEAARPQREGVEYKAFREEGTRTNDDYETPLKSLLKNPPREKSVPLQLPTNSEHAGFKIRYDKTRPGPTNKRSLKFGIQEEGGEEVDRRLPKQDDWVPPPREAWMKQKATIKEKFPEGWAPLKKLSPDAMAGIRALHAQAPDRMTTDVLANEFKVSPEAIRRILKSKWTPSPEEESEREARWFKRGTQVWTRWSEMGIKPPKKWREQGVPRPEWMLNKRRDKKDKYKYEAPPMPDLVTTRVPTTATRTVTTKAGKEDSEEADFEAYFDSLGEMDDLGNRIL